MSKHVSLLLVLVACAFQPIQAAAVVQTIYYLGSIDSPTPTVTASTTFPTPSNIIEGTTRYSPIGTAENGNVKYDMEVVLSRWVQEVDGTPQTLLSAPFTKTYNLEENASHLAMSAAPGPHTTGIFRDAGVLQNCDLDTKNMKGICVQIDEIPLEQVQGSDGNFVDRFMTVTATYTAALTPVATFTASDAAGTGAGGATKSSSARKSVKENGMSYIALLAGSMVASLFVLL